MAIVLPFVPRNAPSLYEQRLAIAYQDAQQNQHAYLQFLQVIRKTVDSLPVAAVPFILAEISREEKQTTTDHWALCHIAFDCCEALLTYGYPAEAASIAHTLTDVVPSRMATKAQNLAAKLPMPVRRNMATLLRMAAGTAP